MVVWKPIRKCDKAVEMQDLGSPVSTEGLKLLERC
jgi:hypothetical protein